MQRWMKFLVLAVAVVTWNQIGARPVVKSTDTPTTCELVQEQKWQSFQGDTIADARKEAKKFARQLKANRSMMDVKVFDLVEK